MYFCESWNVTGDSKKKECIFTPSGPRYPLKIRMATGGKFFRGKLSSHADGTDGFGDVHATCIAFVAMSMENACRTGCMSR
jgi:hypothetical protein